MSGSLFRPWLFAIASCLWWAAVIAVDLVQNAPNPYGDIVWLDWREMALVYRIAPWMAVPFVALAAWGFALRLKRRVLVPSWMTWGCGAAALLWAGFVFWRAHEQAFKCAVWAPREEFFAVAECWLPHILLTIAPWIAVPLAAWLVLAALPLRAFKSASELSRFPRPL